jgi:hypothetical protein
VATSIVTDAFKTLLALDQTIQTIQTIQGLFNGYKPYLIRVSKIKYFQITLKYFQITLKRFQITLKRFQITPKCLGVSQRLQSLSYIDYSQLLIFVTV